MISGRAVVAAVLLALMTAGARASGARQGGQTAFRATAEAVPVDVAVRRGNRPVTGLTLDDFGILDNGVPQQIVAFSDGGLPVDIRVVFDVSRSVTPGLLGQLRAAMRALHADLRPGDRLTLLTFNNRVTRLVDATPAGDVDRALDTLQPTGSSAVFDALAVALATPVEPSRRSLVVLFSDGEDTSSVTQPAALLDLVRRTTPTVYIVLPPEVAYKLVPFNPGPRDPSQTTWSQPTTIERERILRSPANAVFRQIYGVLARETGGVAVAIRPDGDLPGSFHQALQEFRDSYVLYFVPAGVERAGIHELTVRVRQPNVEVRARRQYVRR